MDIFINVALLLAAVATSGIFTLIATIISVVVAGASFAQGIKAAKQAENAALQAQAVQVSGHNNNRGLYVVYGEVRVGSTVVYKTVSKSTSTVRSQAAANPELRHWNATGVELDAHTSERHAYLRRAVAICEGPIESIEDIYVDNDHYNDARFSSGGAKHFHALTHNGSASGAYVDLFTSEWDSAKVGKYVAAAYEFITMDKTSAYQGVPQTNYIVKGRLIYDPREAGHSQSDETTWEYSDNPALCLLDYLTSSRYGRGLSYSDVDIQSFINGANSCDVIVNAGPTSVRRLACNIALDPKNNVLDNVRTLLSSMRGSLHYVNGKYTLVVEDTATSIMSLNEDNLVSTLNIQGGERDKRLNRCTIKFANAARDWQPDQVSWPPLDSTQYATYLSQDAQEQLHKTLTLDAIGNYYRAEDLAEFVVRDSRIGLSVSGSMKSEGIALVPGDVVDITYEPAGYTSKLFRIQTVAFDADRLEVNFTARAYDASVYTWSTKTNEPTYTLPAMPTLTSEDTYAGVSSVTVVEKTNADGSAAQFVKIDYTVDSTGVQQIIGIISDGSANRAADSDYGTDIDGELLVPVPKDNTTYTYSLRAIVTTDSQAVLGAAVEGIIDVPELTGSKLGGIEAGATVGAEWGVNLYGQPSDAEILNSELYNQLALVELEPGDVLDLETGLDVEVQTLSDVAKYAYDNALYQQTLLDSVQVTVDNINATVGDLTAGLSDVYLQTTAPVAGVSGIPNPIPDNSRWYDSDDGNKPYVWDGSQWVDIQDSLTASNAADITTLQTQMTTAQGDIIANASAISVLDTTVTTQGDSITAVTSDVTDLQTNLTNAEGTIAANSAALTSLQTLVDSDGLNLSSITSQVTELSADLVLRTKLEEEDEDLITDETGAEIDLEEASDIAAASGTAINALDTRVIAAEDSITSQSSAITQLSSDITDFESGLAANASATDALTTRVTSNENSIDSQGSLLLTLQAEVTQAQTDITSTADATNALEARVVVNESGISANSADITALTSTVGDKADASALTSLTARVTDAEGNISANSADITSLTSTVSDKADASALTSLTTRVTDAEGNISANSADITSLTSTVSDKADASALTSLTTRVTDVEGDVSSQASSITSLSTTVGNNQSSIATQASSIDGLEAQYTVKADVNGRVSGFGLASSTATATPTSDFIVIADRFAVVDPDSTAANPIIPFQVLDNGTVQLQNVEVESSLIAGTISANSISIDNVTLDTSGGNLIVRNGGVNTTQIASNAVTNAEAEELAATVTWGHSNDNTILTLTFTGTGQDCEIYCEYIIGGAGANNHVGTLEHNGVVKRSAVRYTGSNTMASLITTSIGTNTVELIINTTGSTAVVPHAYLRALEVKR